MTWIQDKLYCYLFQGTRVSVDFKRLELLLVQVFYSPPPGSIRPPIISLVTHEKAKGLTGGEKRELIRRRFNLLNYVLRSPLYDKKTKVKRFNFFPTQIRLSLCSFHLLKLQQKYTDKNFVQHPHIISESHHLAAKFFPQKSAHWWQPSWSTAAVLAHLSESLLLHVGPVEQRHLAAEAANWWQPGWSTAAVLAT